MQCILITYSVFTEARQSTYFLVNFHSNLSSSNFRVDTFDIFRVIARQTLLAEVHKSCGEILVHLVLNKNMTVKMLAFYS